MARARKPTVESTTPAAPLPPLPEGWAWVRFGDVVREVNTAQRNPLAAGLDRFVGLEHLEPEDLRVRSWGNVADGTTFTRVFRAGQVLFGKRRVYQRKAAVPDFDGICSGDILVFEAKPSVAGKVSLVPGLLPFIVQTERFVAHATATSGGSLSPRTKFKELAKYRFALPTTTLEQCRLADLLTATADAFAGWNETAESAERCRRISLERFFTGAEGSSAVKTELGRLPRSWRVMRVDQAGEVRVGQRCAPEHQTGKWTRPYLRVANVFDGYLNLSDIKEMDFDQEAFRILSIRDGDVLLAEGQSRELVGRSAIYRGEVPGACYQNSLLRFRAGAELSPEFAHAYFQFALYSGRFARIARQTTSIAHYSGPHCLDQKVAILRYCFVGAVVAPTPYT